MEGMTYAFWKIQCSLPTQEGLGTEKTHNLRLFVQHKTSPPRSHWRKDAVKTTNASFEVQEPVPL